MQLELPQNVTDLEGWLVATLRVCPGDRMAPALARAEEYHDHPDDPDKDDPLDVVVWQASGSDDDVSWPSPWGDGRPGWGGSCRRRRTPC